jgi:hypothetical protein
VWFWFKWFVLNGPFFLPHNEPNPQVCDATGYNSTTGVWLKNKSFWLWLNALFGGERQIQMAALLATLGSGFLFYGNKRGVF